MARSGVVLYGPPAAGKSTVTRALEVHNAEFRLYRRRVSGRDLGQEFDRIADADLNALRERREVVWENRRYGATMIVDGPTLTAALDSCMPVVALGQVGGVAAVCATHPQTFLTVALSCPRSVAEARMREAG